MVNDMLYVKGRGYALDEDGDQVLVEVVFSSPVLISNGQCYRFLYIVKREGIRGTRAKGYLCIALCNADGTLMVGSSGIRASWDSELAPNGSNVSAHLIYKTDNAANWADVVSADNGTTYAEVSADFGRMVNSIHSVGVYQACFGNSTVGTVGLITSTLTTHSSTPWSSKPMTFPSAPTTTPSNDIVSRARELSSYKYWYGGAGQVATAALAQSLYNSYKNNPWTKTYYDTALKDVDGTTRVADCSYLVNYAYGKASPGNHGGNTTNIVNTYAKWSGTPKDGMILWRSGHCGIYAEGKAIQMKSQAYDYIEETYNSSKWTYTLYDKNRTY